MLRLTLIHAIQFAPPPLEQTQAFVHIADLVAQIVRPAAVRIHVVEILMQLFRQQETDDVKILVMMRRQPARILLGFPQRPFLFSRRRAVNKIARRKQEGRTQSGRHGMMAVFSVRLPSISWNRTFGRHSSGSSACTKSAAVTPPDSMMSSASRKAFGV